MLTLAKEIVYRLMVSQIEQENIDLHLFTPEERRDGTCDIDKFISRLENEPLCLYEDRKRDIILSELTWRTSNEEKIQNITAIKGAFIDFVGNYDVFSEEEQRELRLVIFKVLLLLIIEIHTRSRGRIKRTICFRLPFKFGINNI